MEVEVPIISVRKIVKQGNDVRFYEDGGTISNKDSGRVLKFYEHDGVYFLKLKVDGTGEDAELLGFHRQGLP